jgi:hypothetical protein
LYTTSLIKNTKVKLYLGELEKKGIQPRISFFSDPAFIGYHLFQIIPDQFWSNEKAHSFADQGSADQPPQPRFLVDHSAGGGQSQGGEGLRKRLNDVFQDPPRFTLVKVMEATLHAHIP